jgi:hypothetical protein
VKTSKLNRRKAGHVAGDDHIFYDTLTYAWRAWGKIRETGYKSSSPYSTECEPVSVTMCPMDWLTVQRQWPGVTQPRIDGGSSPGVKQSVWEAITHLTKNVWSYTGTYAFIVWTGVPLPIPLPRAGLWVGRAGHLPRALTSRGRRKGSHRPAKR